MKVDNTIGECIIYMDAMLDYVEKRGEKRTLELCQLLVGDGRLDELTEAANSRTKL